MRGNWRGGLTVVASWLSAPPGVCDTLGHDGEEVAGAEADDGAKVCAHRDAPSSGRPCPAAARKVIPPTVIKITQLLDAAHVRMTQARDGRAGARAGAGKSVPDC